MACNDFSFVIIKFQYFTASLGYIAVTCSVKTITPDSIFLIKGIRKRIHESIIWHCLMKGGIKDPNLWDIGKYGFHRVNSFQVCRIMKGSKIRAIFYSLNRHIIKKTAALKKFTTMDQAMSNCIYFVQIL